jgi:cell division protein FtsW
MSKEAAGIIIIVLILTAIGIVMVYSASAIYADQVMGSPHYFLIRQFIFSCIGLFLMVAFSFLDPAFLQRYSRCLMLVAFILLVAVYVPFISQTTRNTKRWLHVFGWNLQPAEFVKIAICVYFSDYLSRNLKPIAQGKFLIFMPLLLVLFVCSGLILLQPDLGTVVILFSVSAILFFLSGLRQRYIWLFFLVCSTVAYFAIIKVPYRLRRIGAYLDPWSDPLGSGFQIIQSLLALALGGFRGVGLGQSTQKLFYLPQSYTDFIFSIVGEELGFIGASFVVILFLLFLILGIRIAQRQFEPFKKYLTLSLVLLVIIQAVINILVATGLLPTKGLPLPFISYGGSSLVVNMIIVGILLSIDRVHVRFKR